MHTLSRWLRDAEAWLDARGRGAWIAAMVLGFIFIWPIGLALLFYMIWSNRMSCSSFNRRRHAFRMHKSTGNTAFDSYRDETLKRLEEEQSAFHGFLERLRQAKDKAEFDQFMEDRKRNAERGPDMGDEVPA
ncbi:MAG: DUF2852 domain-containing protein [Pseudomonadota bacterium]